MKIEHIFNAVNRKHKNNKFIDSQEFDIGYWKTSKDNYKPTKFEELKSDYSKMYYYSLYPSDSNSLISKYDEEKINAITDVLGEDLLLISGDFWGIQKFIFDGITTSKASKILRSRSAIIQLITYAVVEKIKDEFKDSEAILFGAGKFMIVAKNEHTEKIEEIQKELDKYFLKNYFGQNGFILSYTTTTKDKLLNQDKKSMEKDLLNLGNANDTHKFNKFDLLNRKDDEILIDPFKEAKKDDEICEFCSKRVKTHNVDDTKACEICFNEIELGKQLSKKSYITIFSSNEKKTKDNIYLIKLGDKKYYAKLIDKAPDDLKNSKTFDISSDTSYFDHPKWSLNSYVPKNDAQEIITFEDYLKENNNPDGETISSGLMVLKADIDKLGDTFRELYKEDFKKFNRLSREVDFFFSDYITSLIAKKKNIYTVFAGGDDLFLIGEYKKIVEIAKEIRREFLEFSLEKATISMGLVMFKPSTPITQVSKMADEAEKRAKIERDSIDIFGVSMKFNEFLEIEKDFKTVTDFLEQKKEDKTTLYYRLIELCDMKENIEQDIRNAMWKSKLNYLFRKESKDDKIFKLLNNLIEKGEKFKPSVFLKIYNNRDEKNKKENKNG